MSFFNSAAWSDLESVVALKVLLAYLCEDSISPLRKALVETVPPLCGKISEGLHEPRAQVKMRRETFIFSRDFKDFQGLSMLFAAFSMMFFDLFERFQADLIILKDFSLNEVQDAAH